MSVLLKQRTNRMHLATENFYERVAHAVTEAETKNLLSASWIPRKVGGIVPVQTLRPGTQGSQPCKAQLESKGLRTRSTDAGMQKTDVQLRQRTNSPLLGLLSLFRPSTEWMMPACSLPIQTLVSETASRPHLKTVSHQLSQHPWASQADA